MHEASRYSFNEAAGHYAGSDGEPCTADEVVAAHVYDALRARLAEAERLLRLAEDHIPSDWVYWRDDYHWFVGEPRASETGCAAHTETNQ